MHGHNRRRKDLDLSATSQQKKATRVHHCFSLFSRCESDTDPLTIDPFMSSKALKSKRNQRKS